MAPIKYNQLNINNIEMTKLEDNDRVKSQKIAYLRYKNDANTDQFIIQTPEIFMNTYGIPKSGQYYQTEASRSFIKVPLDDTVTNSKLFKEKLMEIDAYFGSEDFKKKNFDKFADKFEYIPLVREPQELEETEESIKAKQLKKKTKK